MNTEYTAIYIRDGYINFIITVSAESSVDATDKIKEQLQRPGRQPYYNQWEDGGKLVVRRDQLKA